MTEHTSSIDRRVLLGGLGACAAYALLGAKTQASAARRAAEAGATGKTLHPFPGSPAMRALPLGAIKPTGWLRRQLEIQAAGLGGRLDETWPDVGPASGWLGGPGESWERGPYYLDGLLPLAWLLDSAALKAKAQKFIDWTLDHPWPNGMIGPRANEDWWPRMVILKVLIQYHEATADPRVIPVMSNYFAHQLQALPGRPLKEWGRFRWQDELVAVLWLYERTGDARWLDLAQLLRRQGFDWQAMFADFPFKEKVTAAAIGLNSLGSGDHQHSLQDLALSVHGVNNAQAIKASPLWYLISGQHADREAVHHQLAQLDDYHGLPNGMFSADEHLAGRSPSQGVELCAIVETLYSLEIALAITGDATLADRIERIAYNALPGAFTDDMWAHQYDQQPNQVECSLHRRPWTTNGPEANLFGLEPHFGCCTANFHQGWPKLTSSLWMATADALTAVLYAPCTVNTQVGEVRVRLEEETDYPFRDHVKIVVQLDQAHRFTIRLRIPGWSNGADIRVNGSPVSSSAPGTFAVIHRHWQPADVIEVNFKNEVKWEHGFNGSLSVQQGALLFALPIGEAWVKLRPRGLTADWQVYPTTAWNYGLVVDQPVTRNEQPVGPVPFSKLQTPVTLRVAGRIVPQWKAEEGAADPVPPSPIDEAGADSQQWLTLVPYAAAKLRITSFPDAPAAPAAPRTG